MQGTSMLRAGVMLALLVSTTAATYAQKRPPEPASGSGRVFRDCPACPEMVVVPAGEFMMGSPQSERGRSSNEGPQRTVTIKAFAMGKFEVTFAQWDACAAEGGCKLKPSDENWGRGRRAGDQRRLGRCTQFVAWLSRKTGNAYRLPSEADGNMPRVGRRGHRTPIHPSRPGATNQLQASEL
jgi:formylglycine-generating enzyme required for sulfatase activity